MTVSSLPQATLNDCTIRDNLFASKGDVLWPSDNRLARHISKTDPLGQRHPTLTEAPDVGQASTLHLS